VSIKQAQETKHPLQKYLEKQGYLIRYRHYRYFIDEQVPNLPVDELKRKHEQTLPTRSVYNFGGKTECVIIQNDRELAIGVAICSLEDNYCKAVGRDYALKRAYKGLTENWSKGLTQVVEPRKNND
jgi:hypothetical protein